LNIDNIFLDTLLTTLKSYSEITEEVWALARTKLKIKNIYKKGYFVREGELPDKIGFVIKGLFRAYYSTDIKEGTVYFRSENRFLNAYSARIDGTKSKYSIQALEDSLIFYFFLDDFEEMSTIHSCWSKIYNRYAEVVYLEKENREKSLLCHEAKQRYEYFKTVYPELLDRIPQYMIASYLGISSETLSRIRK
jgi:CRP-like cAMP-binding protein